MKKIIIISLFLYAYTGISFAQTPEKIYSYAKVSKSNEYYIKQAELWWNVLEKNKKDEDAWMNYYKANRYAKGTFNGSFGFDDVKTKGWNNGYSFLQEESDIYSLIEKNIPNSYPYYRLKKVGFPNDDVRFQYLEKAYQLNPDDEGLYEDFIKYYEMKVDMDKRKEFSEKLYKSNFISSGFLAYSYNVLMSIKQNGIILTFGDNDTYPLWILQDALGIRTDVVVLCIPLLSETEYRNAIFKKLQIPGYSKEYKEGSSTESEKELIDYIIKNKQKSTSLYIGLPAWNQFKLYENNLFIEGLVLEYATTNIDNIAILKNNFENKYALDYIKNRFEFDISEDLVNAVNSNYLPAIFKLYEHYKLSGDIKNVEKMKELGLLIAKKSGQEWYEKATKILQ